MKKMKMCFPREKTDLDTLTCGGFSVSIAYKKEREKSEIANFLLNYLDSCGILFLPNKPNIAEHTFFAHRGSVPFSALTFEFAKNAIPQVRA